MDKALDNRWVRQHRQTLLAKVRGQVLEIGFGTGLNLEFYPNDVEALHVLDPSEGMHRRAHRRLAESNLVLQRHVLSAERLPFENDAFDHVVCTFTLCTVADPTAAVREVRRVLRPGGGFHVFEHVRSHDAKVGRWQDRLTPIQRVIGAGCHLNRDMDAILRQGGFEDVALERVGHPKMAGLVREHVRGTVTKRH